MTDGIQLIHSDDNGNPKPGSALLHWVRVTDNPSPHLINQLTAGGAYPHADCGETDILSSLRDRGKDTTEVVIEHDASAGSRGTNGAQLVQALTDFGLAASWHTGTLGAGYVMNPLGGRLIAPAGYAAYKAASANEFVAISTPGPWDNVDMDAVQDARLTDLWNAVFGPVPIDGGETSYPAKPNNVDIIRRKLSGYAHPYPGANGSEISVPASAVTVSPLTAAQTAALAQVPTILAILQRLEAAAKTA